MNSIEKELFVKAVNDMIEQNKSKYEIKLYLTQCDCTTSEITDILEASNYYKN